MTAGLPGLHLPLSGDREPAVDGLVNPDAEVPAGDFYVTVRDGSRVGFLLGPYTDYRDALANVRRGRDLACSELAERSRAWFFAYGTSRLPVGASCATVFGR